MRPGAVAPIRGEAQLLVASRVSVQGNSKENLAGQNLGPLKYLMNRLVESYEAHAMYHALQPSEDRIGLEIGLPNVTDRCLRHFSKPSCVPLCSASKGSYLYITGTLSTSREP